MEVRIIEVCFRGTYYDAVVDLRQRVLRVPFGHPLTDEELAGEFDQIHLAALIGDRVAGCLLLREDGDSFRMRQVAVDHDVQGLGVGKALVEESERVAIRSGKPIMRLHARGTAIPFYEKLGYMVEGDVFEEIGIPHQVMSKRNLRGTDDASAFG